MNKMYVVFNSIVFFSIPSLLGAEIGQRDNKNNTCLIRNKRIHNLVPYIQNFFSPFASSKSEQISNNKGIEWLIIKTSNIKTVWVKALFLALPNVKTVVFLDNNIDTVHLPPSDFIQIIDGKVTDQRCVIFDDNTIKNTPPDWGQPNEQKFRRFQVK